MNLYIEDQQRMQKTFLTRMINFYRIIIGILIGANIILWTLFVIYK